MDTRPVDAIFLTPGTELAVFERGNWLQRLRDQGKRSLILGLGVVDGFRTDDFRAVLPTSTGTSSIATPPAETWRCASAPP